jgi:methionyl-tRNA formyltransferase
MAARKLRTVFFGSSQFSVPSLERLLAEQDVVAVCSQPDKPAGRGLRVAPTAVTVLARNAGHTVFTPQQLDRDFVDRIASLRPELLATASYGKILPRGLLELPGVAALNVHPSLLPHYRGATPIQSALRDGCDATGVTIFWMTARMDAGDIALSRSVPIESFDNFGSLHDRLALVGADMLAEAALLLDEGRLPRVRQDESAATYCRPLTKDDRRLRFDVPARNVVDQIRSLSPTPAAWMLVDGKRLKVLEGEVARLPAGASASAGECIISNDGFLIAAASDAVRLLRVVPEGKPAMTGAEFAQASSARRH